MHQSGIYSIENKVNGKRYIGSAINLRKRWIGHVHELRRNTHHSKYLQNAWDKYGEQVFGFKTILICEPFELLRYEQALIDKLNPEYNCSKTAGSVLGFRHSQESKDKISMAKKGKKRGPLSEQQRERMSIALSGKRFTEEHRHKISISLTGRSLSEETKHKISKSRAGKTNSPATRRAISTANKGRVLSEEHRAALIRSNTTRVISDETRARMRAAQIGKKASPETRAKMSAARNRLAPSVTNQDKESNPSTD